MNPNTCPPIPAPAPPAVRRPPRAAPAAPPLDVSVCIVNWNGREMLRACLASLLCQPQGASLEVIVVDNASTDGAADMVASDFPGVRLIRNATNKGFARANNQAARRARGHYLFFLNNDTVVPPDTVGRLVARAESSPEVGMIGPRLRDGRGRVQTSYRPRPTLAALLHRTLLLRCTGLFRRAYHRYRRDGFDPDQPRHVETLMGAALFLPQWVFFECGPWDEDFTFGGEDLHFSACVARRYPLLFAPDVEITHYGGVSTRRHVGFASAARAAGYVQYLRKSGYGPIALLTYKLALTLDAPLQVLHRGTQHLFRLLCAGRADWRKSRLAFKGAWHLLARGLPAVWKA